MSQHSDINTNIDAVIDAILGDSSPTNEQAPLDTNSVIGNETIGAAATSDDSKHIRIVNTFMKRRTHMNKNAELALTAPEFAHYLVNNSFGDGNLEGINDLRALFVDLPNGSEAPLTLEIGVGLGDSFIEMAAAEPSRNFVGIEVHAHHGVLDGLVYHHRACHDY